MFGFLMFLFILLSIFLAIFILIQQGKGDMGLGSLGGSTQMLFGGSGGQSFFEKTTWVLGAMFILGALGLAVLKSKEVKTSQLQGFASSTQSKTALPKSQEPLDKDIAASVGNNSAGESNKDKGNKK